MKPYYLITFCVLWLAVASADVAIQNSYYTTGSECKEDIFLHNMDYYNSVSIGQLSVYAGSQAQISDESQAAALAIRLVNDPYGMLKALDLKLSGMDIRCSKQLSAGGSRTSEVAYSLTSRDGRPGKVRSDLHMPTADSEESIKLINSKYSGSLGIYDSGFLSLGQGLSSTDATSEFEHDLKMHFSGKQFQISAYLNTLDPSSGGEPVDYEWNSFASQGMRAVGGISILANQGNREAKLGITGKSNTLTNKYSPDEGNIYGWENAIAILKTTEAPQFIQLYMQYTINSTG